jgi:DNA-binding NarL/FixJ family response regulator
MVNFLIVEDNDDMRRLIKSVIATNDDTICECSDGGEAFDAYCEHKPDWVTMDIELPTQDGLEATRQIKAAFPDAKVLIVTSYDTLALRESARKAGACGYVVKENLLDIPKIIRSKCRGINE